MVNKRISPYPKHNSSNKGLVSDHADDLKKSEYLGKKKCRPCSLSPGNWDSYFGLYKFMANALFDEFGNDIGQTPVYPCQVVNFYKCPYEEDKRKELFILDKIVEVIGRALSKALNIKGTRIIYNFNFESGIVQEIDTFVCGDLYAQKNNNPGAFPIEHKLKEISDKIEKLTMLPIRNLDDIFEILTNKEKLDIALQIGLDEKYLKDKDELINLFMSIKDDVKKEDLVVRSLAVHNIDKNKCSLCSLPANICTNRSGNDIWICMNHLKDGIINWPNSIL